MELAEVQRIIEATYGERDRARVIPSSVAWLCEEVGELAKAAAPTELPAPGLFSMTIVCPILTEKGWLNMRASASVAPPGG